MAAYSTDVIEPFKKVSTATLTTVLLKKGLRNVWLRGSFPLSDNQSRAVGPAFTLRFIPAREDLATPESWTSPTSTRTAIEQMPAGCMAVVAADGYSDAGAIGDILCQRMKQRGVVRDLAGVLQTGLDVWAAGTSAPPAVAGLTFVGWQDPVGCGGVAIIPDDIVVADQDGAVVVPGNLVSEVLDIACEQENLEEWILNEVRGGASLSGLYPPNEANMRRYARRKK